MPTCRCGAAYEPRQVYKIPGAQEAPAGCRSCVRLCGCGAWFRTTDAERAAQEKAVQRYAKQRERGKAWVLPDTLPVKCPECRPAPKIAKSAEPGRVLKIGGRR